MCRKCKALQALTVNCSLPPFCCSKQQGSLEGKIAAKRIVVAEGGRFSGEASCDIADVAGRFEGISLVCSNKLTVKSTGHIASAMSYASLSVDAGGVLSGSVTYASSAPVTPAAAAAAVTAAAVNVPPPVPARDVSPPASPQKGTDSTAAAASS
jgi:Polymer-forming cytoskeletal